MHLPRGKDQGYHQRMGWFYRRREVSSKQSVECGCTFQSKTESADFGLHFCLAKYASLAKSPVSQFRSFDACGGDRSSSNSPPRDTTQAHEVSDPVQAKGVATIKNQAIPRFPKRSAASPTIYARVATGKGSKSIPMAIRLARALRPQGAAAVFSMLTFCPSTSGPSTAILILTSSP